MINLFEVAETNEMIAKENLDVRTITLGISLLDCIDGDLNKVNGQIYEKITETAKDLVKTGEAIEKEFGIPIVNKRISVTPMALVGGTHGPLTPTLITASASVTPWNAPAIKGLSSGALQNTTSFIQSALSCASLISAVSLMISPISRTASILIPVLVEPRFTELQTRSVACSACGIERISSSSALVIPFDTSAE